MIRSIALAITVAAAACGGKSTPAAAPEPGAGNAAPAAAACCCDYIKEEGDPATDDWSENQTYEQMDEAACQDLSGQCTDSSSCAAVESGVTP